MAELDFESKIAQLTNPIQDHVVEELIDWAKAKKEKLQWQRKGRENIRKWNKQNPLKKYQIPVPRGPLAIFGSKLLGPLQWMMPGTLHSGELTHAQRRDTHHPNTNIWGYTGD